MVCLYFTNDTCIWSKWNGTRTTKALLWLKLFTNIIKELQRVPNQSLVRKILENKFANGYDPSRLAMECTVSS